MFFVCESKCWVGICLILYLEHGNTSQFCILDRKYLTIMGGVGEESPRLSICSQQFEFGFFHLSVLLLWKQSLIHFLRKKMSQLKGNKIKISVAETKKNWMIFNNKLFCETMEIYHYEDQMKKGSGFWILKSWVHEIGKLMSVVHIVYTQLVNCITNPFILSTDDDW